MLNANQSQFQSPERRLRTCRCRSGSTRRPGRVASDFLRFESPNRLQRDVAREPKSGPRRDSFEWSASRQIVNADDGAFSFWAHDGRGRRAVLSNRRTSGNNSCGAAACAVALHPVRDTAGRGDSLGRERATSVEGGSLSRRRSRSARHGHPFRRTASSASAGASECLTIT